MAVFQVNLCFPFPVGIITAFMLEENLSGSVARIFYVPDALLSPVQQCQNPGVNSKHRPKPGKIIVGLMLS